ncbi:MULTISPECIES: hypothetical protein [unclassified Pseudomonas]|uniref:hypothetical protein n=1 Tax=unclassified Pseudomonas TaxID=196821 RepID=UPI000BDAD046|nr:MULTISPECIES: hypothetical protein [unclassified Pseudomonas]PVZ19540.1 hypothetical protein F474_00127 [Pseudomonas sp. URIL14HWK12:I12]PVZ22875.1 hypothetical protein F470_03373 [Pseudomonas sp. URIL14HWK12:I10]PVZ37495.1 hypothetical protein F472_00127 [Pseudomonas sp. URIL14HWK12:I11]SNZ14921.1 hypothetical protein SAMN05660463_02921 [Pseudomonas sp. URIL14HWK12:I9]
MEDLKSALSTLDPPLKHKIAYSDQTMLIELWDPEANASVSRLIEPWQYQNRDLLHVIVLHAINELKRKGSRAQLQVLPLINGRKMEASDFTAD